MQPLPNWELAGAMWTYKALDFGLMDEHYAGVRKDLIALL